MAVVIEQMSPGLYNQSPEIQPIIVPIDPNREQQLDLLNIQVLSSMEESMLGIEKDKTQEKIEALVDDIYLIRKIVGNNNNYSNPEGILKMQEHHRAVYRAIKEYPEQFPTMDDKAVAVIGGRDLEGAADFDGTHTTFQGMETFDQKNYLMLMAGSPLAEQVLAAERRLEAVRNAETGEITYKTILLSPLVINEHPHPSDLITTDFTTEDDNPHDNTIGRTFIESGNKQEGRDRIAEEMVVVWGPVYNARPDLFRQAGASATIREGVPELYSYTNEQGIKMTIVSANLEGVVLGAMGKVEEAKGTRVIGMTPDSIASTDKVAVLTYLAKLDPSKALFFIGDGSSDICTIYKTDNPLDPENPIDPSDSIAIYFALEGSSFAEQLQAAGKIYFTYRTFNDIRIKLAELTGRKAPEPIVA